MVAMRTYVSPVGYDSRRVTRPVLSRGIDSGDAVVLLRPDTDDNEQAAEAIDSIESMLQEVEPDVELRIEQIDHDILQSAILECSDVIRAAEGRLICNFGGGARDVLLPFLIATLAHERRVDTTLFFSDIDFGVSEWTLPSLRARMPGRTTSTFAAIADASAALSLPELTERVDISKSTVTRHVTALEEEGLVDTWKEGKTKYVRVSLSGRLLRRAMDEPDED